MVITTFRQDISCLFGGQEELFLPDWSHELVVHGLNQGRQHLAGSQFCELVGQWSILRGGHLYPGTGYPITLLWY
jgi:hypothetical protein